MVAALCCCPRFHAYMYRQVCVCVGAVGWATGTFRPGGRGPATWLATPEDDATQLISLVGGAI